MSQNFNDNGVNRAVTSYEFRDIPTMGTNQQVNVVIMNGVEVWRRQQAPQGAWHTVWDSNHHNWADSIVGNGKSFSDFWDIHGMIIGYPEFDKITISPNAQFVQVEAERIVLDSTNWQGYITPSEWEVQQVLDSVSFTNQTQNNLPYWLTLDTSTRRLVGTLLVHHENWWGDNGQAELVRIKRIREWR